MRGCVQESSHVCCLWYLPICSASSVCRTRSARFCSVKDSAPRSACPSPACLARIFTISSCVAYTKSGSLNAPQVVAFELFFLSLLSWGFMRRGYCQQSGLVRHAKQTGYYISWELRRCSCKKFLYASEWSVGALLFSSHALGAICKSTFILSAAVADV